MSRLELGRFASEFPLGWAAIVLGLFCAGSARADSPTLVSGPAAAARSPWSFGVRIGGYGFREVIAGESRSGWSDCRMNGLGLFAERAFTDDHFFLQGAVDLYFAESFPMSAPPGGTDMDRVSGLTTVAAGFRMWPHAIISPHLQLGTGLEVTHVSMGKGTLAGSFLLPLGFLGLGGDLGLGDHLRAGATLRALIMANFEHDAAAPSTLDPQYVPAAQLQFYLKYDL